MREQASLPLPTFRFAPRGARRTARGQCGTLFLHCEGLAPSTPCRSPGAPAAEILLMIELLVARPERRTVALFPQYNPIWIGQFLVACYSVMTDTPSSSTN